MILLELKLPLEEHANMSLVSVFLEVHDEEVRLEMTRKPRLWYSGLFDKAVDCEGGYDDTDHDTRTRCRDAEGR